MKVALHHPMDWHNGERELSFFSDAKMYRRQDDVRKWVAANDVDTALFTFYHRINITQTGSNATSAGSTAW